MQAQAHLVELHSFPTRRSSDLELQKQRGGDIGSARGHRDRIERRVLRISPRAVAQYNLHIAIASGAAQIVFRQDRKSTRLNSSHVSISYAVFRLKKKKSPAANE